MKKTIFCFLLIFFDCSVFSQTASNRNWTITSPFDHHVFIENKGQLSNEEQPKDKLPVLYYNRLGKIKMYFSKASVTFGYDSIIKADKMNLNEPELGNTKTLQQYLSISWQNANPAAQIEVIEPVKEYFTFNNPEDKTGRSGIMAHAWRKLIYKNLYKNIDVEFTYPEDKGGMEYTIILHPGADITELKMTYSENAQLTMQGNDLIISSSGFSMKDHAPKAIDEDGNPVSILFLVDKKTVSFNTNAHDKTKSLTIDPWITSLSFGGANKAFDIDFDNNGNVYIGGGDMNIGYLIQKYDTGGKLQWTYIAPFQTNYYGAFTLDRRSGTSYFGASFNGNNGCIITKVNTLGLQTGGFNNSTCLLNEIWRMKFDYLNNQIVVGGGNLIYTYQAGTIDSSLSYLVSNNIFGATLYHHDISLLALDGEGYAYMSPAKALGADSANFNNVILRLPLPSLTPTAYMVPDGYSFIEASSIHYSPRLTSNGFNGMVAAKQILVTYDGATLKKWRPTTGTFINSVIISASPFYFGGLDMDCGDNLYVGNMNTVVVYDSSLNSLSTVIPLADTVYGLAVSPHGKLYACGNGFVQAVNIAVNCRGGDGIKEINNTGFGLTIFPNPFSNSATIALNATGYYYLELYDLTGQKLKEIEFTGNSYTLSAEGLAKGMYFVRVFDKDKNVIGTRKIVVQ